MGYAEKVRLKWERKTKNQSTWRIRLERALWVLGKLTMIRNFSINWEEDNGKPFLYGCKENCIHIIATFRWIWVLHKAVLFCDIQKATGGSLISRAKLFQKREFHKECLLHDFLTWLYHTTVRTFSRYPVALLRQADSTIPLRSKVGTYPEIRGFCITSYSLLFG